MVGHEPRHWNDRVVTIPRDEYGGLRAAADDLADLQACDRAKAGLAAGDDELIPAGYVTPARWGTRSKRHDPGSTGRKGRCEPCRRHRDRDWPQTGFSRNPARFGMCPWGYAGRSDGTKTALSPRLDLAQLHVRQHTIAVIHFVQGRFLFISQLRKCGRAWQLRRAGYRKVQVMAWSGDLPAPTVAHCTRQQTRRKRSGMPVRGGIGWRALA